MKELDCILIKRYYRKLSIDDFRTRHSKDNLKPPTVLLKPIRLFIRSLLNNLKVHKYLLTQLFLPRLYQKGCAIWTKSHHVGARSVQSNYECTMTITYAINWSFPCLCQDRQLFVPVSIELFFFFSFFFIRTSTKRPLG